MIQTSKRAQSRRIARKRSYIAVPPKFSSQHPSGNRLLRRKMAKFLRGKKRGLTLTPEQKREAFERTREYKRYKNGWKRECTNRSQIRRIGSRAKAKELKLI